MERGIDNDKEREKTSWERRKARQRYDGNRNPELRNSACNLHNNDDALRTGERKLPCSLIVTHREEREQWRKKRKWISSCTWWSWMSSLLLSILHCLWGDRSERTRRSDDSDGGGEALGEIGGILDGEVLLQFFGIHRHVDFLLVDFCHSIVYRWHSPRLKPGDSRFADRSLHLRGLT